MKIRVLKHFLKGKAHWTFACKSQLSPIIWYSLLVDTEFCDSLLICSRDAMSLSLLVLLAMTLEQIFSITESVSVLHAKFRQVASNVISDEAVEVLVVVKGRLFLSLSAQTWMSAVGGSFGKYVNSLRSAFIISLLTSSVNSMLCFCFHASNSLSWFFPSSFHFDATLLDVRKAQCQHFSPCMQKGKKIILNQIHLTLDYDQQITSEVSN